MTTSYYQSTLPSRPAYPSLVGRRETEVCVVGGGFAGLNTALGLSDRGIQDVVLIEGKQVGFGASGRNGGFVFGGFSRGEESLLDKLGAARARALYRGTIDAVDLIRRRTRTFDIKCDLVDSGVIWANWFRDPAVLRSRQKFLQEHYGVDWTWLAQETLRQQIATERYADGLFEKDAFHFHPLKYAAGLAAACAQQGVTVHERTPATGLVGEAGGWRVSTPEGSIHARQVVLACGGYLAGLRQRVDASVLPIATYAMVTEPLGARMDDILRTRAAIYDTRFAFDYYRPLPDSRLLWGGRISIRDRSPQAVKQLLYRDLLKVFPQLEGIRIEHAWSGLMSYARHQMPQVGRIDEGLWLAQAFGGHGVAPTTFAGEVLASAIAGDDERWREFSEFGLVSAWKPAGFVAAQLSYWWAEAKDAWKAWREA